MSGLSIYNMCIPPLRSCLGSSDVNDYAYVPTMTPNSKHYSRRYSSVEPSDNKRLAVGFWRSWEFLTSYPKLSVNKHEGLNGEHPEFSGSKTTSASASKHPVHTHSAKPESEAKNLKSGPDVLTRSISLETSNVSETNKFERKYTSVSIEDKPCSNVEDAYYHLEDSVNSKERTTEKTTNWNLSQEAAIPSELSFTSGDIMQVSATIKSVNLPNTSTGAIRKCKNISRSKRKTDRGERSVKGCENNSSDVEIEVSPPITNCKIKDSKNMTSLLPYNNHSLGKDVIDNGTALLSSKLQVHTVRDRLKTFKNWPNKRIQPKTLADAGFFYCGRADIVECYRCGIKGHNWVENDKPMEDHMRWNKDCPFVRENTTEHDNIQVRQGQDICGNLGVEILPNSRPEDVVESETSLEKLCIQKTKGPSHPDQIIFETRLATFENWPKSMKQKPPELAASGFYYLGVGDQTLCFYCGGGLKDWVEEDDPWEQHALWFPKCNFLLLKKTPAFVEAVHKKHKDLLLSKKEESEIEASCSSSNNDTKETSSCHSANNEESKSEDSSTLCKICFKNELGVVFLPCGHMVACIDCALALKECAVCRKSIQATVRAFLS